MINFPPGRLTKILQGLEQSSFDGMAEITTAKDNSEQTYFQVLVFRSGKFFFAGERLMSPLELAEEYGKKLNISIIDAAIKAAKTKVTNPDSFQETFDFLSRMRIIKFEQLEELALQNILITLEKLLPQGGSLKTNSDIKFDLAYPNNEAGWSLANLVTKLKEREQKWSSYAKVGINSADAVPKVDPEGIKKATNASALKHCSQWIDGRRSIEEIAHNLQQDPLILAKNYSSWVNQGWIYFGEKSLGDSATATAQDTAKPETTLPTVLSVDDSPVVQTMLKRAMSDRYNVILASNGMDALKALNSTKNDIKLILLDVTMPDIDGIELCRTIRRFKKFQDLPIIMLTAKDGMFDKVKGKFAGSTEYLTKPVNKENLLETLSKYVPSLAVT